MSLYHHLRGKEELLDALADWAFARIRLPRARHPGGGDGDTGRVGAGRALAHPWALGLLESRRHPGPALLHHHDAVLGCLRGAGFPVELAAHAYSVLDAYVYGFVLTELNLPMEAGRGAPRSSPRGLAAAAEDYPHLVEMIAEQIVRRGATTTPTSSTTGWTWSSTGSRSGWPGSRTPVTDDRGTGRARRLGSTGDPPHRRLPARPPVRLPRGAGVPRRRRRPLAAIPGVQRFRAAAPDGHQERLLLRLLDGVRRPGGVRRLQRAPGPHGVRPLAVGARGRQTSSSSTTSRWGEPAVRAPHVGLRASTTLVAGQAPTATGTTPTPATPTGARPPPSRAPGSASTTPPRPSTPSPRATRPSATWSTPTRWTPAPTRWAPGTSTRSPSRPPSRPRRSPSRTTTDARVVRREQVGDESAARDDSRLISFPGGPVGNQTRGRRHCEPDLVPRSRCPRRTTPRLAGDASYDAPPRAGQATSAASITSGSETTDASEVDQRQGLEGALGREAEQRLEHPEEVAVDLQREHRARGDGQRR